MDGAQPESPSVPTPPSAAAPDLSHLPPIPAESRLDMPLQRLDKWKGPHPSTVDTPNNGWTGLARLFVFGGGLLLAGYGVWEMTKVVDAGGIVGLEWPLVILFAVTFTWIALSATSGVVGFVAGLFEHKMPRPAPVPLKARTALLMPVYNESPARTIGALKAMGEELAALGAGEAFEIFILSDTTDATVWIEEEFAFLRLRDQLAGKIPVWYRRRYKNTARKAGNIADFVTRWGGRYEHMLILDADSVMTGETLTTMARLMEADPKAGIIQTLPVIANRNTLFARLQQFAGRIYGPVIARGLAIWHGRDGNYWGHNAIIRTKAFADCCGLPDLEGRKPFGGHILSHDFVEAALIRRGGWGVYMIPWLSGSYEESPPSILDVAARDRRWAQGNMQHIAVVPTRGLVWPTRVHFATGIMSYLASPIWLLLLLVGLALSLQARFIRPEYFTRDFSLFPAWPRFDAERSLNLFILTMAVLFLPKVLGTIEALIRAEVRRKSGGVLGIIGSFFIESILSALVAPVMMLLQTRHVLEIFTGRDSGWKTQRRDDGGIPFAEVLKHHWTHVAIGAVMGLAAFVVSRPILAWMAPTLIGLILAVQVSYASGSARIGLALRRANLLLIPEESEPPAIMTTANAYTVAAEAELPEIEDGLQLILTDARARDLHERLLAANRPLRERGKPEHDWAMADAKIREARTIEELSRWLTPKERMAVLTDARLIHRMRELIDQPPPSIPHFPDNLPEPAEAKTLAAGE
ncbi:MAG: glucans biosynthesis glucosyltransferase MdoH [Hyphomicrobiaceae bacterium]|nr:glucans biosynthesis glucosyltransferase MdoH [Hyphomicrobiaceae bacterium]